MRFYDWLMTKRGDPDPLGTVARDVANEFWWPEDATTLRECEQHCRQYEMDREMLPYLRQAWHQWKDEQKDMAIRAAHEMTEMLRASNAEVAGVPPLPESEYEALEHELTKRFLRYSRPA